MFVYIYGYIYVCIYVQSFPWIQGWFILAIVEPPQLLTPVDIQQLTVSSQAKLPVAGGMMLHDVTIYLV